ncbi:alkaline phosphatase D family protein [Luteimonas sp. BDR2-5]|uniref:alkaline phosphatase D family protein n=1 Tax=Proluteimonas luteida TaxID=2878685 RepID=UPI001E523252|nr:alkaline phosphatase D family protein [Luteimonas sp. BDR2-5]MCD9029352.1 alkaline phosphatase D family protein [Luteimonas sp. BDR2-5]
MHSPARRRFLSALAVTASAVVLPPAFGRQATVARTAPALFPQSVASGDPRPDRVLLWTRYTGPASGLRLQVAEDEGFSRLRVDRTLAVPPDSDGCVKVRVDGLQPATTYHYRFLDEAGDGAPHTSPHGRTRTAPAPDADVPVHFAFLSCQDYGGRWYNSLLPLLGRELDFVLHLGDFIYETAGDPQFQEQGGTRTIAFDDLDGAIRLERGGRPYYAARSLDNYRQLHRTFRTDPVLQALLARAPLVALWDDHEFSDDCWQDVATYHDGARDERDRERRRNAEQAYFEYLPVDLELADAVTAPDGDRQLPVARDRLFPNLQLWRGLRFGRALELLVTDYRSARPDHPVPEDAFPGALAFDEPQLRARLPQLGLDPDQVLPTLIPYVDLSAQAHAPLRAAARAGVLQAATAAGLPPGPAEAYADAALAGGIALPVLARLAAGWNAAVPADAQVALPDPATLPRGLPWLALGKTEAFGDLGSRYIVVQDSFDLFAALRALDGPESPFGPAQRDWLRQRMQGSDARFKVVASSVSFTSLVLDLAQPGLDAPAPMRRRFYLNLDHWDGFPAERRRLLDEVFDPAGGTILLSGDIHASFATQHSDATVEFTTTAVSSETLGSIIERSARGDDAQAAATRRLAAALDAVIAHGNPAIRHAHTRHHGVGLVRIDGDNAEAEFLELPEHLCRERHYDDPAAIDAQLERHRFAFSRQDMRLRR